MENWPVVTVIVCFSYYLTGIRAFPGYTTTGHSFSVAFPKHCHIDDDNLATLYVKTMEVRAYVTFIYPVTINSVHTSRKDVTVERFRQVSFDLNKNLALSENRVYSTVEIESDNPIEVMAKTFCGKGTSMDLMVVLPAEYYKTTYLVATGIGFPFMIIITSYLFSRPAIVKVHFTTLGNPFNVMCNDNDRCASNGTMVMSLPSGKCWFFNVKDGNGDLHGTSVTSNLPIHVLSGNLKLRARTSQNNDELVMSTSISPENWGKYYFVPNVDKTPYLQLRFHFPMEELHCKVYTYQHTKKEITVTANHDKVDFTEAYKRIEAFHTHIILGAKTRFGVVLFAFANGTAFMESLIPKSLWTSYAVHIQLSVNLQEHILLVTDTINGIFGLTMQHESLAFMGENRELTVTEIPVTTVNAAYLKDHRGKLMFFVWVNNKGSIGGCQATHYTSSINHERKACRISPPVVGDGRDNDCDGTVDEELADEVDDDADGMVDEDIAPQYQDGGWSEWKSECTTTCSNAVTKMYRTCDKPFPSMFGKRCEGVDEMCATSGTFTACPSVCGGKVFSSVCKSKCPESCICAKGNSSCRSCKRGHFATKRCSVRCPDGWSGFGCSDLDQPIAYAKHFDTKTPMWTIVLISLTPIVFLLSLTFCLSMYARPQWRKKIFGK